MNADSAKSQNLDEMLTVTGEPEVVPSSTTAMCAAPAATATAPAIRWYSQTFAEFVNATPSDNIPWVIEPLVPLGDITFLIGDAKTGKTELAFAMAAAVATGQPLAGRFRAEAGGVLLILEEDRGENVLRRLQEHLRGLQTELPDPLPIHLMVRSGFRLDCLEGYQFLVNEIATHRPRLVIIDSFSRIHGMRENSSGEMTQLLQPLPQYLQHFGSSVVFLHHTSKPVPGMAQKSVHALRGSTAIAAFSRSIIHVQRNGRSWRVDVDGNYDPPDGFWLTRQDDEHGRRIVFGNEPSEDGSESADKARQALEPASAWSSGWQAPAPALDTADLDALLVEMAKD